MSGVEGRVTSGDLFASGSMDDGGLSVWERAVHPRPGR